MTYKKLGDDEEGVDDGEEEEPDVLFRVKLDKPEPSGVKVSKRNVCYVTITCSDEME